MKNILNKPFPASRSKSTSFKIAAVFGAFVWMFLYVFTPFGLGTVPNKLFFICFIYGLITFLTILFTQFTLVPLFPKYYSEDLWTVGKEITQALINILLVAIGNFVFSIYLNFFPWSIETFMKFIGFTLAVAVFPVSISIIIRQSKLERENQQSSNTINSHLEEREYIPKKAITLSDDEGGNSIEVFDNSLILLESADNYVKVFYFGANENVETIMLRSALNRFELMLAETNLFRVHRSFLVNTMHIEKVKGDARGYNLKIKGITSEIPVARRRIKAFDEEMNR